MTEFESFDQSSWSEWIDRALAGRLNPADRLRNEEIHETILRVFKSLAPEKRSAFSDGLSAVIESTPFFPSHAEQFFYLFQVTQVAKPRRAKATVRRLLSEGIGRFEFHQNGVGRSLQNTVLGAAAKYEVDDWLRDYIWRSVSTATTFSDALFYLRLLSRRTDDSCFKFHQVLIPRFSEESHANLYEMQIVPILRRLGCRLFLLWYHEALEELEKMPKASVRLWEGAAEKALHQFSGEMSGKLMLAEIKARREGLVATEILAIAGMPAQADGDLLLDSLFHLHPVVNWEYIGPENYAAIAVKEPHTLTSSFPRPHGSWVALNPRSPAFGIIDQAYRRVLEAIFGAAVEQRAEEVEY